VEAERPVVVSEETRTQEMREQKVLGAVYLRLQDIPDSPAEPETLSPSIKSLEQTISFVDTSGDTSAVRYCVQMYICSFTLTKPHSHPPQKTKNKILHLWGFFVRATIFLLLFKNRIYLAPITRLRWI
jgi:hypothetical protein